MYWFTDNWYGNVRKFKTFSDAIKAAKKQMGATHIFDLNGEIVTVIRGDLVYF